jgi:hypothetical protein
MSGKQKEILKKDFNKKIAWGKTRFKDFFSGNSKMNSRSKSFSNPAPPKSVSQPDFSSRHSVRRV